MGMNVESHMGMYQNTGMGKEGSSNAGGGAPRRKPTRRQTTRRVTIHDDDKGDQGFDDAHEMANIRVKVRRHGHCLSPQKSNMAADVACNLNV